MPTTPLTSAPTHAETPIFTSVDLDTVDARQLGHVLARHPDQPRPQFLVDCGSLKCLRTLGVSYVVSQLLVLRQYGASIWLRNPHPSLQHSLKILHLTRLFPVVE